MCTLDRGTLASTPFYSFLSLHPPDPPDRGGTEGVSMGCAPSSNHRNIYHHRVCLNRRRATLQCSTRKCSNSLHVQSSGTRVSVPVAAATCLHISLRQAGEGSSTRPTEIYQVAVG